MATSHFAPLCLSVCLLLVVVVVPSALGGRRRSPSAFSGAAAAVAATTVEDTGGEELSQGNYPLRCLVRQFNFTASVTDANGKRCRGQVSTKACFGSCDSYEVGTFEFPWIVRVQPVCNYNSVVMKEVRLSDCDPGVENGALVYRFPEASSCSCSICDPTEQACETSPTKRSTSRPVVIRRSVRQVRDSDPNDQDGTYGVYEEPTPIVPLRASIVRRMSRTPVYDRRTTGWMAWTQMRRRRLTA